VSEAVGCARLPHDSSFVKRLSGEPLLVKRESYLVEARNERRGSTELAEVFTNDKRRSPSGERQDTIPAPRAGKGSLATPY
jgi:hypothetical protein